MLAVNGHVADPDGHMAQAEHHLSLSAMAEALSRILHGLFSTGAYGVDSPPALYLVTTVLGMIGLAAGVVAVLRRVQKQPWLWLVLAWPVLNLAELVAYAGVIALPGAREFFPSIACLALLAALGWSELLGAIRPRLLGWAPAMVGLAVSLLVPWVVVAPAYAYPLRLQTLPAIATPVHATFGDAVELVGVESSVSGYVQPDKPYGLTLYWRLRQPTERWLDTFVHVDSTDPDYVSGASYDGAAGGGMYPPNFWQPGQIVVDRYSLTLRGDTRPDRRNAVPLAVRVGMYDEDSGKVPADPPEAGDRGLEVGVWKLAGQPAATVPSKPLAEFDGGLRLLAAQAKSAPGALNVDLQWQANSRPAKDFTAFVQLLSPDGRVLAQHDSYPMDGRYRTSQWSAGERVFDRLVLPLKEALAPGDRVVAGIYVLPDARPLPTTTGEAFAVVPLT